MPRRNLIKIRVGILAKPVHLVILYCDESPPGGGGGGGALGAGDTAPLPHIPRLRLEETGDALLCLLSSAASASVSSEALLSDNLY